MILDLIVLAALGLSTYVGYRKGFVTQLVGVAAIIAVYLFAPLFAPVVRNMLFSSRQTHFPGEEIASLAIAGVAIFIIVYILMRLIADFLVRISESFETIDEILGGVLGFLKGFLILYLTLCGLAYAEEPLKEHVPSFGQQVESSLLTGLARKANIITFLRFPEAGDLRDALLAAKNSEEGERDEALVRLLENEDFQSVAADEELLQAASDKNYSKLLADARVRRLLADEDFRTVLSETDWSELAGE